MRKHADLPHLLASAALQIVAFGLCDCIFSGRQQLLDRFFPTCSKNTPLGPHPAKTQETESDNAVAVSSAKRSADEKPAQSAVVPTGVENKLELSLNTSPNSNFITSPQGPRQWPSRWLTSL